jgi:predicted nucleic acid-binding protein
MMLYLDTSALVKLYVEEAYSKTIFKAFSEADIIATHKIAFIEVHSAFARLRREKKLNVDVYETLKKTFLNDWENFLRVGLDNTLLQIASEFSEAFALRAYDCTHLAAAHYLFKREEEKFVFACFDQKLNQAAKVLSLELLKTH